MGRCKLQVQITLDGYIASPTGAMDMFTWNWDGALQAHVQALTEGVDLIVLGRNLAEGFIPHWASVASDLEHPERLAGQTFTKTPKMVFSRTLHTSPWSNTTIGRDLTAELQQRKRELEGDLIAYGGARFVTSLIDANLIDQYHLFVNPVAIGTGMPIFSQEKTHRLHLLRSTSFACGIVELVYTPIR